MNKQAYAACPACHEHPCAEFAMKGEAPRWRCNSCGATGPLTGSFTASAAPAAPKQQPRRVHKAFLAALVVLAGCGPAPAPVAVDHCLLREYLEECDSELVTPEEAEICRARAPLEATRVLAAVAAECRKGA